jgi:hypothetical protein
MSAIKKLIKSAVEETLEIVKDSAEQIVNTVSPDALFNAATGGEQPKPAQKESDMTAYLKSLGNGLEGDALKKKQMEVAQSDEQKVAALRTYLQATPAHMRLPPEPPKLRAYEQMIRDEEEKKAMQVQQQQSSFVVPTSKPSRGGMGKQRPKAASMELKHDNKSG